MFMFYKDILVEDILVGNCETSLQYDHFWL